MSIISGGASCRHDAHWLAVDSRVVLNFIIQALKINPITMYGDGTQTRSFCYFEDLIDGFIRLMDTSDEFTGPVNLRNLNEFTIRELSEQMIDLIGSPSAIQFRPSPQDDPMQRQPNITLAFKTLNWEPKVQMREELTKTIIYFDALLSR